MTKPASSTSYLWDESSSRLNAMELLSRAVAARRSLIPAWVVASSVSPFPSLVPIFTSLLWDGALSNLPSGCCGLGEPISSDFSRFVRLGLFESPWLFSSLLWWFVPASARIAFGPSWTSWSDGSLSSNPSTGGCGFSEIISDISRFVYVWSPESTGYFLPDSVSAPASVKNSFDPSWMLWP